jgi:hypothetical protein
MKTTTTYIHYERKHKSADIFQSNCEYCSLVADIVLFALMFCAFCCLVPMSKVTALAFTSDLCAMSFDMPGDQCVIRSNLISLGPPGGRWNVRSI